MKAQASKLKVFNKLRNRRLNETVFRASVV